MKEIRLPFLVRLALIVIVIIGLGYICVFAEYLVVPLLFSFLFAVLLLPAARLAEDKLRLPRSPAAVIVVVLFIAVILLILYVIGAQVASLGSEWPVLKTQLQTLAHNLQVWAANTFHINIASQTNYIKNAARSLENSGGSIVGQTVLSFSSVILFLVFVFVYTILILCYRRLLRRFITASFHSMHAPVINDIFNNIKQIIRKYITGLFLEMAVISIVAGVAFWIEGMDYVFLLALLVGVLNVIPYVGIFTAALLDTFITFATGNGQHALIIAITIICIHLVDSNLLMPKIVGSKVKLNPLVVIIGVVAGEMLTGISGMFLAIPYLAIAKVVFDRVNGMHAWGILLGDEQNEGKPLDKKDGKRE